MLLFVLLWLAVMLLPTLAVKPPVATSTDIRLIEFKGHAPSRRIAMVWRKSSALSAVLEQLAKVIGGLRAGLLDPHPACGDTGGRRGLSRAAPSGTVAGRQPR